MFKIIKKERLNPTVTKMVIDAPFIAKKAEPGQFIILRALEDSERIPLTIADYDREGGTITIIYQIVGGSTMELDTLEEGQCLHDFVGPLGVATHTDGLKKVAVVGGGVGCAIALPVTKKLHEQGCEVHAIVGFRNKDLVILEDEFKAASSKMVMMTDDGSHGEKAAGYGAGWSVTPADSSAYTLPRSHRLLLFFRIQRIHQSPPGARNPSMQSRH